MDTSARFLKKDKYFSKLIQKHGPIEMSRGGPVFKALARSIVYQQLSGKAAETIFRRFVELFQKNASRKFPTPEQVLAMPLSKLRSAGLSKQKASYLRDLAHHFHTKKINHKKFHKMSNDEIIEHLLRVKGIGEWTVHMFLIFTLGRPDVLPVGDLGIRKGFQVVYKLKALPDKKMMEKLAMPWRQHATLAARYLWKAADDEK